MLLLHKAVRMLVKMLGNVGKIRLVSFADGAFVNRKAQFLKEAQMLGVFDEITIFDSNMLPMNFKEKHMRYMQSNARGFGYWIWKPLVISEALDQLSTDDILVYLDIGFTLNPAGRSRFLEYIEIALDSSYKMLSFQNVFTESRWTKMDLAIRLQVDTSCRIMHTCQLSSGFIVLGKTISNTELLKSWQQLAVESNYRYSDDSSSVVKNHPEFFEHRHDQSISSLLRKMRGTEITHYEVQPYSSFFKHYQHTLPAWATRLRN